MGDFYHMWIISQLQQMNQRCVEKNVYVCVTCNRVTLLNSRDWHKIVNQLYFSKKKKKKEWEVLDKYT